MTLPAPQVEPDRGQRRSRARRPAWRRPVQHPPADLRGDHEAEEEDTAGTGPRLGGRLAQRDLRVLAGEEEDRDEHEHRAGQDDVLDEERPDPEDAGPGSAAPRVRSSTKQNTTSSTAPTTIAARSCGLAPAPQRRLLEAEDAQGDARRRSAPARGSPSGPACASVDRLRHARSGSSAMIATGMLTQKIARHVHSVRKPPSDRPDRGQPAGDAEEDGQRPAALAQREGLHDDGQRGGEHDRCRRRPGATRNVTIQASARLPVGREPAHRRAAAKTTTPTSPSSGDRACRRAGRRSANSAASDSR